MECTDSGCLPAKTRLVARGDQKARKVRQKNPLLTTIRHAGATASWMLSRPAPRRLLIVGGFIVAIWLASGIAQAHADVHQTTSAFGTTVTSVWTSKVTAATQNTTTVTNETTTPPPPPTSPPTPATATPPTAI